MPTVNSPRGMRDFLPADKARRERVLAVIRERYRAHGFDEIETPVMEDYERLHAGIGGDNEKLAFSVLRRGLDADSIRAAAEHPASLADLGLRYDLTVPLARFYATHRAELPGVFRSVQVAPVWRAERPQKGRYRQFVQCDIDVIGDATARAEVELILATLDTFVALGLQGVTVRINDRRALDAMLSAYDFAEESRAGVLVTIDKLDKIGVDGVIKELTERGYPSRSVTALAEALAGGLGEPVAFTFDAIRACLPGGVPDEIIAEITGIGDGVAPALDGTVPPLVFDPFLVRGMGYYTGTIFEVSHPSVPYSLAGGGRYDGMIGRFLGQDVPAVGFSIGFERIVDLVSATVPDHSRAVVLVHDRGLPASVVALKATLIAQGARVRLEQRPKNLKALLERATADGYTEFALVNAATTPQSLEFRSLSE